MEPGGFGGTSGGHQALRATATVAVGVHLQNRSAGHPQAGRDLGAAGWSADAAEKLGGATDDGTKGHRRMSATACMKM